MPGNREFGTLLIRSLAALAACVFAVLICYYFVDRPVAFFVHKHQIAKTPGLVWLTYPPPWAQSWSPLVLALLVVRRVWRPWRRWQQVLFLACVSLIVADQCRESLGDIFGRYWPETWRDNNPSLIGTGTYGFDWFHPGPAGSSFPSGHATRILAFFTVLWLMLPSAHWLYAIVAAPMCIALVTMNYHFTSDVLAGSVLGGIVGAWAVQIAEFGQPNR